MSESRKIIAFLRRVLYGLPIIVGCMIAAVLIARKALGYATPQYEAVAKIKLDENSYGVSGANLFKDFDVFSVSSKIAAEVELLRSEAILEKVAARLGGSFSIYRIGNIKETELGETSPFQISSLEVAEKWLDRDVKMKVKEGGAFELEATLQGKMIKLNGALGDSLSQQGLQMVLDHSESRTLSGELRNYVGQFRLRFHSKRKQIAALKNGGLDIKASEDEVPIIRIAFRHPSPERAARVANAVAEIYIEDQIAFKTEAAGLTLRFIDQQIAAVGKSLDASEAALESYRDRENVINTRQETETNLRKIAQMKIQLANIRMREHAMDSLDVYINAGNRRFQDLAPSFEAFGDLLFTELLKKIKAYEAERIDLLINYTPESRSVLAVDAKIAETISYIKESIGNARKDITVKRETIAAAITEAESDFEGLPARDRQMVILDRDFQLNQKLYLFLTEKRMESAIQKNAAMSFHRIIERAYTPDMPISPKPGFVAIVAGFLGLLIGVGLIVAREFFGQKIKGIDAIEKRSEFPVIAALPLSRLEDKTLRASANELAARLLARRDASEVRSLALASAADQEGRDLLAMELAKAFAAMGRKVALIELHSGKQAEAKPFLSGESLVPIVLKDQLHIYRPSNVNTPLATMLNHPSYTTWWTQLQGAYELVITNAGACGDNADTLSVMAAADQVLWLSRSGVSHLDAPTQPDQLAEVYGIGPFLHVMNTSISEKGFKGRMISLWQYIARLPQALSFFMKKARV